MEEKNLTRISFGSFIKLFSALLFSLGMLTATIIFIISLFGGDASLVLGSIRLTGITAGLANLVVTPTIFFLIGALWGILAFLPFKLVLKIIKGIKLNIEA